MAKYNNVKVLCLDGVPDTEGDVFERAGLSFDKEVYVFSNPGNKLSAALGTASLHLEEDGLYGDIETFDNITFPFDNITFPLYPSVTGTVLERQENLLTKTKITSLGLTILKNSDPRIEPIGKANE